MRFDADDLLSLGDRSALYPSAATLIVVVPNINDDQYVIYRTEAGDNGYWRFAAGDGYLMTFRSPRLEVYPASPFMPNSGDAVFSIVSSASTYQIYKNGTGAGAQAAAYSAGTQHAIGIGGASGGYVGDIAELVICSAALSDANRGAAEVAANAYWGAFL
jgi:hypothetical protein